ncbi:MAG: UDP-N-acetylmuramoyl-L-alanyl-D-glutamate--2,6-diaminopimelate ligase, partial [Pseudomonas graminis]
LDQGRVTALAFDVAVMTNLSRDHLDYHGTMEAYAAAKAKLFAWNDLRCRVVNLDDAFGRELAAAPHASRLITYSQEDSSAYLFCRDAHFDDDGVRATLLTPQGSHVLRSSLLGRFNLSNVLAAVGALMGLDYPLDDILKVLPTLEGPAGRMQRLGGGSRPLVVVDYAHTPDALEKVLAALRPHAKGQLTCLFGCGGDRDRGKRPLMAEVVERLADKVLVTDDNPRSEDPAHIFDDIRAGFVSAKAVDFVAGRGQAIAQIIAQASAADVIVLAGKGHEDYQEINGQRQPFSDLEEATKALDAWEAAHA